MFTFSPASFTAFTGLSVATRASSALCLRSVCPPLSLRGTAVTMCAQLHAAAGLPTLPSDVLAAELPTLPSDVLAAELPMLPSGVLVVQKPPGWTSFGVVGKLRWTLENHFRAAGHTFKRRSRLKVGHGGTLDPLATGLLVIGVGDGCRQLQSYLAGAKGYDAVAQLGSETDTQDSEGAMLSTAEFAHVTLEQLQGAAVGLMGEIMQRPPIYSALRKDGKRLHQLARAGKITPEEVPERPVTVHALDVSEFDAAAGTFGLRVRCSGGTYVRSLIVEMGRTVGSAAHMTALERTRHGPFVAGGEAAAGEGADTLTLGVQPLREEDFEDPARLLHALEQTTAALAARAPPGTA